MDASGSGEVIVESEPMADDEVEDNQMNEDGAFFRNMGLVGVRLGAG